MPLLQLELARILDHEHTLVVRDEGAERVQDGRLARACRARDDHILVQEDERADEPPRPFVHAAERLHPLDGQRVLLELADGDDRADARERRDDGVDAAAVREARVQARMEIVEHAHDRLRDVRRRRAEHRFADELLQYFLQLAPSLDVDAARTVDQDLRNRVVGQIGRHRREEERQKGIGVVTLLLAP